MRVLVLSNLYPPNVVGGYERLCAKVVAGLAARGDELIVLTSRYGGLTADYPGQRVLRELELLTGANIYTPFAGDRTAVNAGNLATLRRVVTEVRPDVVFAWNLFFLDASLLDWLEANRLRTVVMLTDNWLLVMRNPDFWQEYWNRSVLGDAPLVIPPPPTRASFASRIMKRLARRQPGVEAIFGSAFMRDLYQAGGVTFARSHVIHNGVEQGAYAGLPGVDRTRLVQEGMLRLLFAGRLVDLKGAHTAIAALTLLDAATLGVHRIRLTLLGDTQDAPYMARLHAAVAESGRTDDIDFALPVAENRLPSLFAGHDIYLFPSLYEPFSLTLIHALALGIPTVASDAGGNGEIVTDGEGGLLFPKGNPVALATAVSRLAADGPLRARVASEGMRVAGSFTFERMLHSMIEVLHQK